MKKKTEYMHVGTGTFRATNLMNDYIQDILVSGMISYGKYSKEFEKTFTMLHNSTYGILSNSGTSSLLVALQAMKEVNGWNDGDEVIVPATTFIATPNIVIHAGLTPVFVDVEPRTYGINPIDFEKSITSRTCAVIPVHLFGQACLMNQIMNVASRHYLGVIEDSCETMFVHRNDQSVGSIGDIGCFSMYVAHILTTGVGGISITDNPSYAAKMRSLVNHGLEIDNLNPDDNFSPQPMLGRRFTFDSIGHSFRITEFEAAIGLAQLHEIIDMERNDILIHRRRNARWLQATIKHVNEFFGAGIWMPTEYESDEHAWMMFPILLPKGESKANITRFLNAKGIETRDMPSIIGQPTYMLDRDEFPVSDQIEQSGFYVGCHQDLTDAQMEWLNDSIVEYYAEKTTNESRRYD